MKKGLKKIFAVVAALTLSMGMATTAFAAENMGITVNGNGIVLATPDTATIYLSVRSIDKTALAAQEANNKIITEITKAMLNMGITPEDIVTSYTHVYPTYSYDSMGNIKETQYQAYASLQVSTKDIDNAGLYIDNALAAGATGFDSVFFSLSDTSVYYAQALQIAVKNARNSAQAIATACGRDLGDIVAVSEMTSNFYYENAVSDTYKEHSEMSINDRDGAVPRYETQISYGDIQVSARITAVYRFN